LIADESSDLKPDYLREAISVCLSRAGLAIIPADKLESLSERICAYREALQKIVDHESRVSENHTECGECHDAYFDDYFDVRAFARAALTHPEGITPQEKDGDGE
jgi:hypothetical protein